jgi:hypothetical protein
MFAHGRESCQAVKDSSSRMERMRGEVRAIEGHDEHHATAVKVVRGVTLRASDAGVGREGLCEARQPMPEETGIG